MSTAEKEKLNSLTDEHKKILGELFEEHANNIIDDLFGLNLQGSMTTDVVVDTFMRMGANLLGSIWGTALLSGVPTYDDSMRVADFYFEKSKEELSKNLRAEFDKKDEESKV